MKHKPLHTIIAFTLASVLLLTFLVWGPLTVLAEDQPDGSIIVTPQTTNGTWGPGVITATTDVTINAGVVITVAPGTTIHMADGVGLTVNGDLHSTGPVTFTTASAPATPGAWLGITYAPGSSGSLEGATVEYAQHALTLNTTNPITVSYSTLRLNQHQTGGSGQDAYGAGLVILDGDHTIAYTDIYSNVVRATGSGAEVYGGGVDIRAGATEIAHSRIFGNSATSTRSNGGGGGVVIRGGSAPLIRNTEISSNTLITNRNLANGGGIGIYGTTQAVIRDSWIVANESVPTGGYAGGGGIGFETDARARLIDGNVIASNRSWGTGHSEGGAIDAWERNVFTVTNNLIYNNVARSYGGAMNINANAGAGNVNIFNNTIVGNSANRGGALHRQSNGRVFNNVIVGNTATNTGGGVYGSSGSAGYNDVWGNTPNNYNGGAPGTDVQIDPLFVGSGDLVTSYQLRQGSPVIDLGTNSGVGLPDDDYSDTPRPVGTTWDIGFDEVIPFTATKSVDLDTASGGMPLVYTLVISNPDPRSALVDGQISDPIPLNTAYSDGPTCNLGTCAYDPAGEVITWTGDVPGSAVLTLSFTVQVDLGLTDGTEITNQADVTVSGDILTTDPVTTTIYNPVLAITKQATPEPVEAGERLDYTIVIDNNGLGDATGVTVSDPLPDDTQFIPGSITLDPPTAGTPGSAPPDLASDVRINAGQRVTVTYAVTVDQPLDADTLITNTVSVTSVQNPTPISTDVESTVSTSPAVNVVKDGPSTAAVGETVVYSFTVTNVGNTLLHDAQVMDDYVGSAAYVTGDDGDGWLDLSEAWIYTASATVQGTDPDPLVNTATVTATDALGTPATAQALHTLDIQFAPALAAVKDGPDTIAVGETVVYTFTVSNDDVNGDGSPLQVTSVNDDVAGDATYVDGDDGDGWLQVGEDWIYTAAYTALVTDPDPLENTVTVTGEDRDGGTVSTTDTHSVDLTFAPALAVIKDGPDTAAVGETVIYTFTVSNDDVNGDGSPLQVTSVNDDVAGDATYVDGDDGDGWLQVGEDWIYTAAYTALVNDPDPLENTVTVTGEDRDSGILSATDAHSVDLTFAPALTVVKDGPDVAQVGETVVYTFTVSNDDANGDGSPLQVTSVNDDVAGDATYVDGDDGDGWLQVGEEWIYSASYTVLGSDPDPLENTVTVTGEDRDGGTVSAIDTHSTAIGYAPALTVVKDGPDTAAVGETLIYTFTISHDDVNGDGSPVQITGVSDDIAGDAAYVSGDDGDGWLQVGEDWVYSADYTVLGTDSDPLANTVTVTGADRDGGTVSATDTHNVDLTFAPALTVVKDGPNVAQVGETVVYTFTISNDDVNGDGSPLQITGVSDDVTGDATYVDGDDGDGWLQVGEEWIYSASYTLSITDPDPLANTVTVTGEDRDGGTVSATDTHSTAIGYAPALTVVKDGPDVAQVGETVVYTFTVSNDDVNGDGSPLQITGVSDDVAGDAAYVSGDDGDGWLQVGEEWIYSASYTVLVSDPDPLENTVTVTGEDHDGGIVSATDTHSTAIGYAPALTVVKDGPDTAQIGETVVYTFTVSNDDVNGDGSPVSDLTANDDVAGAATYAWGDANQDGLIQVGESWIYTVSYTIAATDTSPLVNTVTVEGLDRDASPVNASDTHSTMIVQFGPDMHLLFLPMAMKNVTPPAPDLVVEQIIVTSQGVQIIIKNQGDATVNEAFWVDLYVDPNPVPTGVNQIWDDGRSTQGMTWGVTGVPPLLLPGQNMTLNMNNVYYSNVTWPLPAGTPVYVQVDSAKLGSPYGAVLEGHEMSGGHYNNIHHVLVSALAQQAPTTSTLDAAPEGDPASPASIDDLPTRP